MLRPASWILPLALVTLVGGLAGPSGAAQSRPKEVRTSIGRRLVEIPGGSFDMGSTVGPDHTLRGGRWDLPGFFLHAALRGPCDEIHRRGFRVAADRR